MKLLAKKLLHNFKEAHADARSQLDSWEAEIEKAQWTSPHDLKNRYPKASLIGDQHVVFNICGNRYRIWAQISYKNGMILVRNIGTHKEYDSWNIG